MNAPARLDGRVSMLREAPTADEREAFVALSSWLTGFDVSEVTTETVIARRFALFARETPALLRIALLDAWRRAGGDDDAETRRRAIADDPRWSPWTRALTKLWYQGRWTSPHTGAVTTTPAEPGMMWHALGVLPQGLDAPGPGRWSAPPPMTARPV
ncbi:MAG: hypothetical protein U0325_03365 [Polyangiales bacterium]